LIAVPMITSSSGSHSLQLQTYDIVRLSEVGKGRG